MGSYMLGSALSLSLALTLALSIYALQFENASLAYAQFDAASNSTSSEGTMGSKIVLLSQKLKKESFGGRDIIGQVKNIGSETADYVLIHLTVYNRDGEVIATNEGYAEPSTLQPGQKSTFEIFADKEDFKGMDYYELSLDWLNHHDSAQGYVQDAQIYEAPPTD